MDVAEVDHFTYYCDLCPTNHVDVHPATCRRPPHPSAAFSSVTFVGSLVVHPSLLCSCGSCSQTTVLTAHMLPPCPALIMQNACMFVFRKIPLFNISLREYGVSRCYFLLRSSAQRRRSYPRGAWPGFHGRHGALTEDCAFGRDLALSRECECVCVCERLRTLWGRSRTVCSSMDAMSDHFRNRLVAV